MDALKKAEAANKERTPPEISVTETVSESRSFFPKENTPMLSETVSLPDNSDENTLNLLDWETASVLPVMEDERGFDWLTAEISLPAEELALQTSPEVVASAPETPEFFIDESNEQIVLENFAIEDPANTPAPSEEFITAALQAESDDFTAAPVKPSNSIEFTPPAATPPENAPTHSKESVTTSNQETAQRIFDARQQTSSHSHTVLYVILAVVLLGMLGVYGYSFLFSNTPSVGLTRYPVNNTVNVAQNPTPPTAPPPNNPPNPTINNTAAPSSAPPVNNAPNFQPIVPLFPPSTATIEKNGISLPNGANEPIKTTKTVQKNLPATPEKASTPLQSTEQLTGMLSLKKDSLTHASRDLNAAYQALQQGDLTHSERAYKKVLQYDGRNRDSLLGLAAIALQQGRVAQAQYYYQQILQFYPQDSLAQAGLISSLGERSPDASISQLKTMLAQLSQKAENLPQVAYLQFTLGNVYARQQAWTEAQQAYFEAYRTEPRADYAYNLAISLDQLHQYSAAANYYQQALQLGRGREKSGFDRQAAAQRLQELNPPQALPVE